MSRIWKSGGIIGVFSLWHWCGNVDFVGLMKLEPQCFSNTSQWNESLDSSKVPIHIYWCASFTVVVEKGRNLSRKRRRGRISRNLARIRRITPHQSRPSTMFNVCSKRAGISQRRSSLSVVQASEDPELNCVKNVWWAFGLAAEFCTPIRRRASLHCRLSRALWESLSTKSSPDSFPWST